MSLSLIDLFEISQERTEKLFHLYLKEIPTPAPILQQAMAYAVFNGGKRIRPLLVYAIGHVLDVAYEKLDAAACSVEMIHSYSLIHDDLPAMDNADLRRGKPACHKAYGEAMAILAGDALQAFVFQLLAIHPSSLNTEQRLAMVIALSEASGPYGMAAGQALDITIMDKNIALDKLTHMNQLKTGALLRASIKLGMLAAPPQDEKTQFALEEYAECIGLAFQIQDDLLDMEGDTETLGKPQGIDVINNKVTYPMLLGVEETKLRVRELSDMAIEAIQPLGKKAEILREVTEYLFQRRQ